MGLKIEEMMVGLMFALLVIFGWWTLFAEFHLTYGQGLDPKIDDAFKEVNASMGYFNNLSKELQGDLPGTQGFSSTAGGGDFDVKFSALLKIPIEAPFAIFSIISSLLRAFFLIIPVPWWIIGITLSVVGIILAYKVISLIRGNG